MGIHLTDLYLDLFGPISEVYAQTAQRVSKRPNGDVVSVQMRFASGATGYINAILVTPLYIGMTVFPARKDGSRCETTRILTHLA